MRHLDYQRGMRLFLLRQLAALLLVPALVVAGLAAGAAGVSEEPDRRDPALVAFLAMGGDIADICGQRGHGGGVRHCDACRLVSAAILPTPSYDWSRAARATTLQAPETPERVSPAVSMRLPWAPRAPPGDAA